MRRTLACLILTSWLLDAAAADGPPGALYSFVDERGVVTWSNRHTDERLQLSETPAYSGVLAYTVGAAPSPRHNAADSLPPETATDPEIDPPLESEPQQDH